MRVCMFIFTDKNSPKNYHVKAQIVMAR